MAFARQKNGEKLSDRRCRSVEPTSIFVKSRDAWNISVRSKAMQFALNNVRFGKVGVGVTDPNRSIRGAVGVCSVI